MVGAAYGRIAALILTGLGLVQPGAAQELPAAFRAIGQITYGSPPSPGATICTGTLVAPDLVLTAGHCVTGTAEKPLAPAEIRFAQVREVIRSGLAGLPGDMALLRLATAIGPSAAVPIALSDGWGAERAFTMLGYRRDAPERPVANSGCRLITAESALLGLGCTVVSGNSGAPLLVWRGGSWQLVAVLVAQSRVPGPIRAIAVIPDPGLRAHIPPP